MILYFKRVIDFLRRYQNMVVFVGGFLFDCVTVVRIDSWPDLAIQLVYLVVLTLLLVYQYREHRGIWKPSGFIFKLWHFNVEALHFIYGGLLSNYVILYFKSSSGARPVVFFFLLLVLLFINEMPQIRRYGFRLRLGLYAFCLASFLIYFIPVIVGSMGRFVFLVSIGSAAVLVWGVAHKLGEGEEDKKAARLRLYLPAAGVLLIIFLFYFLRFIPPVPLSVQAQGIYHHVERTGRGFLVRAEKQPFYFFWRKDSRPFWFRPGDEIFYFTRVYAPARFKHQVVMRWEHWDETSRKYTTSDLIPLNVTGGRREGYRGISVKANYDPGQWRVKAETEDGRVIGFITFTVLPDTSTGERRWTQTEM